MKYNNAEIVKHLNNITMELMNIEAYLYEQKQYETSELVSEALNKVAIACDKIFEKDNADLIELFRNNE